MTLKSLLLSAALSCFGITASADVIEFPEDEFWLGLSKSLYGEQPDFEGLAKRTPAYKEADEFSRAEVLAKEVARLEAEQETIAPDTQVLLRVGISLGDYDAARGGFPVSLFAPGIYLDIRGGGMQFINGSDYAVLPMTLEQGKALRTREKDARTDGLLLVGDFRKAPGSNRRILANVYRFDYVDQNGSILASIINQPSQSAYGIETADIVRKAQENILDIARLPPLGSDWSAVRAALTENYGFALSHAVAWDDGKVEIRDGKVACEDLDKAKQLRIGFGNDRKLVAGMFARQTPVQRAKIPEGQIDMGFTGPILDCGTPGIADACGVLILDRIAGNLVLTGVEGMVDLAAPDHEKAFAVIAGPDLPAFLRSDLKIAYMSGWLEGGSTFAPSGKHLAATRYLIGADLGGSPDYLRPTDPWQGAAR